MFILISKNLKIYISIDLKWQLLRKSGDAIILSILNTVFCSVGDIIECIIVPSTARIETAWEGFASRVDKCPDSRDSYK